MVSSLVNLSKKMTLEQLQEASSGLFSTIANSLIVKQSNVLSLLFPLNDFTSKIIYFVTPIINPLEIRLNEESYEDKFR